MSQVAVDEEAKVAVEETLDEQPLGKRLGEVARAFLPMGFIAVRRRDSPA